MKVLFLLVILTLGSAMAREFYSIKEKTIQGEELSLSQFKGKVVMVVNIASQCGYTPQLNQLEALYQKYQGKGFVVLGVPTNDFGGQTPESDKAMAEFCSKKYQVTFPLLTKATIQGKDKRDLYKFLTNESPKNFQGEVGWNFEKFLIDRKGQLVGRMRPSMDPMDKEVHAKLEALLK
jgi:glutathione peroxidase